MQLSRRWMATWAILALIACCCTTCLGADRLNLRPLMRAVPGSITPLKGALGTKGGAKETKIDEFVNVGKGEVTWYLIISFLVEQIQAGAYQPGEPVPIETETVLGQLANGTLVYVGPGSATKPLPVTVATPQQRAAILQLYQAHQQELGPSVAVIAGCQGLDLVTMATRVQFETRAIHTEAVTYHWTAQLYDHVNAQDWWQWYDTGYFYVKWLNPDIQGAKSSVSTPGEWRCVKKWEYETGVFDDNKDAQKATASVYATQYAPEIPTTPSSGSLWGLKHSGKASWGGGLTDWSLSYQGAFNDHKHLTCRCEARGTHGG